RTANRWDPDILVGYEIQKSSWGYLLERGSQLRLDLASMLSRVPQSPEEHPREAGDPEGDAVLDRDVVVPGRIVLNLWRIMRKEVTLNIYTFENVYYHVVHRRVPLYSFKVLTEWFAHDTDLWRTVEHYVIRARGNLELLDRLDVVGKTSEMARIFGIQFFEVLSRGSQFRVESMMLRLARQRGLVALSPSVQQRARMRAMEFIPLVMEPQSHLYTSPVAVLDFQSLYPSVMIAHNYCFSTCLGRLDHFGSGEPFVFGCSSLSVPVTLLNILREYISVSPAGVAFVQSSVRRGVLPQMLEEILNTRLMVKQSMKECKDDKVLRKVLDARQLGLKLISNVTYGYTAASFSGRMPCVELADSIVSKGRETLERAIKTVEATSRWGGQVIYGDTDSMFVLLQGKTKEQAFQIGQEIAEVVTAQNPKPIKLKFEKVYLPCVLQTKKRYVGFSYESPDQTEPTYDAKGIETVRRDTCPAVSKLLEKSLRLLFAAGEVAPVKNYLKLQFSKMLSEQVNLQDFIFAKEFRGLSGYKPGACVPALEIARRMVRKDPRLEPRVGERVPYVVVYGSPGLRLIQLVRHPLEVLSDPSLRLNVHYYVTRAVGPALNRVLGLVGQDALQWYGELPRPASGTAGVVRGRGGPNTIGRYLVCQLCPACGAQSPREGLCPSCKADPGFAALALGDRVHRVQAALHDIQQICQSCMGFRGSECISTDCPILYKKARVTYEAKQARAWHNTNSTAQARGFASHH
ncbi:DNA polymerase zeta catalytic subunit, putative, partial [Ixodes scapularis]